MLQWGMGMEGKPAVKSLHRHVEVQRVLYFLFIGGVVASANLGVVWFLAHLHRVPYVVAITIATELSILASFALNDRLTFSGLARRGHPLSVRCLRFHSASALGALLTIAFSTAIHGLLHLRPVIAQLTAIVIVSAINFLMHRFWTYGGARAARSPFAEAGSVHGERTESAVSIAPLPDTSS
jgi:putative flippase GtrA